MEVDYPSCLPHCDPIRKKLITSISARDYSGDSLRNLYAKSESGTNLVMYDVYWLAMMMLFTGSKYLEYISSMRIMYIDNNNRT